MSAISLADLQRAVQNLLLQSEQAADDFIVATALVPRATRVAIYANAYRTRCVEAMSADFSGLKAYLGDNEFESLINAYVKDHPSQYFSLRYLGRHLCEFLCRQAPYSSHRDIYELAQFEWALCNAFDAADADPLGIDDLRRIDAAVWPALLLRFHPSLQWLTLLGNAPALWTALNAEQQPPAFVIEANVRPWIVWRQQLRLLFRPLGENELMALDTFYAGASFAEVCEKLSESIALEQVPISIAGFIQQWLSEGLIVGLANAR
jgi:hypothetical protein